ncbi:MAG: hypothetical protein EHM13_04650, partial [Acidobacteria bacterium]
MVSTGLARTDGAAAPFFFIQISDPQFGFFSSDGFAQETANLEFAIATVNRLRPAFLVATGDLVNEAGNAGQVAEYRRIASKLAPGIPLYNVAGNHDVGNAPTPETLGAYAGRFGPDHYTFSAPGFVGIVVNSCLLVSPQEAPGQARVQEAWLQAQLEKARGDGSHVVVFSHHPPFIRDPLERDEYVNIPRETRGRLLELFRKNGVRFVFAGHHHQNAVARDGDIEVVTTGPIGRPLGEGRSGMRIVTVTDAGITHRYYELSELPNRVVL